MLALDNYLTAEALMIRLNNERGEGVCANNLGNVYRLMDGEFQKAVNSYNRAVAIATNMLNTPTNDVETQKALRTVLANRLNNMGVLFKENTVNDVLSPVDVSNAESYFERSLALHRQNDNLEGIAQVSGNLGQLYLIPSVNKIGQAAELITDAFNLVRKRNNDPVAFQYACLNMGLLCEAQGKFAEAVTWYMYVLQKFNVVVKFIQKLVLTRLIAICAEKDPMKGVNRPELADALKKMAQPLFGDLQEEKVSAKKNITFVLDTSGSMSGTFIRTCRTSIKSIINDNCSVDDTISLIKFDHRFQPVFTNATKKNDLQRMMYQIDHNTEAEGGTAFYDAVAYALEDLSPAPKSKGDKWIISLTDGEDGSPNKIKSLQYIQNVLHQNKDIGLIVITVGALRTEAEIQKMVSYAGDKKGMLIRSEANSGGIKEAFGKAVKIMAGRGNVNVESL
ncbi:vWA-like protein [Rhizoclosmatium globosum]|uniref:VWA-like protein n=1 Tax=Rhizoclosmatium globosum TaxID=329046 RepID=A0A1Y2CSJ4_9FUNG|nr:vWA-like protein [Rhizoclosmatium globosum]|eukprot:ORY49937.1 vWA-like protein [Rhizoclosmatium globosum]